MCDRCAALEDEIAYLKGELGWMRVRAADERRRAALGMTPIEQKLLDILYAMRGQDFTHIGLLMDALEEAGTQGATNNLLKVHMHRVRKKLGGKDTVLNLFGYGYRLSALGVTAYEKALVSA